MQYIPMQPRSSSSFVFQVTKSGELNFYKLFGY